MATPIQLPYFRNPAELPAPLPTTSEILASNDIIKGTEAWATRKVVGVGEHFIVKYSPSNERTTPHRGFFGSVNQSHMPYHLFYWPGYPAHISGPFTTERTLIQGLISKSRSNARDNWRHSYLADFFEEQLMPCLVVDGRTPVFTHSDLQ